MSYLGAGQCSVNKWQVIFNERKIERTNIGDFRKFFWLKLHENYLSVSLAPELITETFSAFLIFCFKYLDYIFKD